MNETEYLLTCLGEECAEVQLAVSKALRFGLGDAPPDGSRTTSNAEEIRAELSDIFAVFEMVAARGILAPALDAQRVDEKKRRVERFMGYSLARGTLA